LINIAEQPMYQVIAGEKKFSVEMKANQLEGKLNGVPFQLNSLEVRPGMWHIIRDNRSFTVISEGLEDDERTHKLRINGKLIRVSVKDKMDMLMEQMGLSSNSGKKVNEIKAPMPGLVLRSVVQEGDMVKKGDTLLVLEAMKMENTIKSPGEGEVSKILVRNGQPVEKGQVLITFR
jgi:biotin carboxyl carrier protein